MALRLGYRTKTIACLAVAVLLSWLTYNNTDSVPEEWLYVSMLGAALCIGGAFRFVQLERYYEGPRTRMVIESAPTRRHGVPPRE